MKISFTKMHGTGNDFILIDEFQGILVPKEEKQGFVARVCRRHYGVGSDGVIFIQRSDDYDAKFLFYNPDGSRAEMCGNGIRCFARYLYEKGLVRKKVIRVETLAGLVVSEILLEEGEVRRVRVDMGTPQVEFVDREVEIKGRYRITSVNMGNPHAVLFFKEVDEVDVWGIGEKVRHYKKLFPQGTNVHFIQKNRGNEFKIRTYERGVEKETLACGTGVSASAVAAVINNLADARKPLRFHARGGDLITELETDRGDIKKVFLTGPADEVFTGEVELQP